MAQNSHPRYKIQSTNSFNLNVYMHLLIRQLRLFHIIEIFFYRRISIYIPSPRYLYLLINFNSSRVLKNDEVYSSSIDKYDRSFIYLPLLGNGLLNYVNFNRWFIYYHVHKLLLLEQLIGLMYRYVINFIHNPIWFIANGQL